MIAEGSGPVDMTTSSMLMKIKEISEVLIYFQEKLIKSAVIVTDSMSRLQNLKKEYIYVDWLKTLRNRTGPTH